MHVLEVVGDPVRRRVVELLGEGDLLAGEIVSAIRGEFGVSQPAVSHHLRVLRDAGVVDSIPEGSRRRYALRRDGLDDIVEWVARRRMLWTSQLDALAEAAGSGS